MNFLREALSEKRLQTYEDMAARPGETRSAETLYRLNILYCKELYVVLGGLEVAVRNSFHNNLKLYTGRDDWFSFDRDFLQSKHLEQVDRAIECASRTRKADYAIDDVVAQLNYGFWVHLCDRPYEKTLWNRSLHKCFPYLGQKPDRINIERRLKDTHRLRNKIAHLEPIIKYEDTLIQEYRNIVQLLYAICPKTQRWFEDICQFENIWKKRHEGE